MNFNRIFTFVFNSTNRTVIVVFFYGMLRICVCVCMSKRSGLLKMDSGADHSCCQNDRKK